MSGMKRRALAEEDRRRKAVTLGEMANQGVDIFCRCDRCAHISVIASPGLVAALGDDCPVPEIGARLRCTRCGGKHVATRPGWPRLVPVAGPG